MGTTQISQNCEEDLEMTEVEKGQSAQVQGSKMPGTWAREAERMQAQQPQIA